MTITKTYSNLKLLQTFDERFEYLKLTGKVGELTFGMDRIFNQMFYTSAEWKAARNYVITRDNGCDLGIIGLDIPEGVRIYVHHIRPITMRDIERHSAILFDPENLITMTHRTHNAIHYGGDPSLLISEPIVRRPNDTCPWK